MSASRDALIEVLRAHQWEIDGDLCTCGERSTDWPTVWIATHQADALAASGIHPFRVDHVDAS